MNFLEFQHLFSEWPVISTIEIKKRFPDYDANALTRWQKKGYLEKLRNGYYRLAKQTLINEGSLFFIANRIYQPSYVSLHAALRYYDFIPEGVFTVTSVSTKKTQHFTTPAGNFSYKSVKPALFFGYRLESFGKYRFKIADPAKTLLDFFYLYPQYQHEDDFFELRLNAEEVRNQVTERQIDDYLELFSSKALIKRINSLKKFLSL